MAIRGKPLAEFQRDVIRYAREQVPRELRQYQAHIGRRVYEGIIRRSPVLSSRSRANWRVTVGTASSYWNPSDRAGVQVTGADLTAHERTHFEGMAQMLEDIQRPTILWIANNAPYIRRLEHGWSAKAPRGMVLPTVEYVVSQMMVRA
jgi:hypothetical protein